MPDAPMIRLTDVTLRYGDVTALRRVSLAVPAGATVGLVGPGGSGKTAILKLICGLIRPTEGAVEVDGVDLARADERALRAVRAKIGMIFQNYALFEHLTVGENLAFPLRQRGGVDEPTLRDRVAERLAAVHLPGIEARLPAELSGGMKKRVSLARATIHDPPILLGDDPTAGLDPVTTRRIFDLLAEQQTRTHATGLWVSHEIDALAERCDTFVMLDAGAVVFCGTHAEALAAPEPVASFFTGALPEDLPQPGTPSYAPSSAPLSAPAPPR